MSFEDEMERCRRRRIVAWEELEEYENAKVITIDDLDVRNILIERARADIELLDSVIAAMEAMTAPKQSLPR